MPLAFANEALFGGLCQIAAGADKECAAPHGRIENAQLQDLFGGLVANERFERAPNEERRHGSRRIEGSTRLSRVPRSCQDRGPGGGRLVLQHALVDSAKLFHVEVAIGDAAPSATGGGRGADGDDCAAHDLVADSAFVEG